MNNLDFSIEIQTGNDDNPQNANTDDSSNQTQESMEGA